MLFLLLSSAAFSWILTFAVIAWARRMQWAAPAGQIQNFHLRDTPRVGGIALWLASCLAWGLALVLSLGASSTFFSVTVSTHWVLAWVGASGISFAAGLVDDLTQRFGVLKRLACTVVAAALACAVLDLRIVSLHLPGIDMALQAMPWLAVALVVLALAGLPHAFNIIDGYNGLAAVAALIIVGALIYIANLLGDRSLVAMLVAVFGVTLGFVFWNYPRGLIFAGDGGSYFWGMSIGLGCVLLVQRHPQVSPWCVMLLLIYPVWETMFSIYRKLRRGQSPAIADSMHFHQLVYKRVVRGVFHDDETRQMLMRNNRTSPYLWAFTAMSVAPAMLFWYSTPILMFFCGLFVFTYVGAYVMIVRFKLPRWISKPRKPRSPS